MGTAFLGIDPGVSGALAVIGGACRPSERVDRVPYDRRGDDPSAPLGTEAASARFLISRSYTHVQYVLSSQPISVRTMASSHMGLKRMAIVTSQ
jgi:hypothetical protein